MLKAHRMSANCGFSSSGGIVGLMLSAMLLTFLSGCQLSHNVYEKAQQDIRGETRHLHKGQWQEPQSYGLTTSDYAKNLLAANSDPQLRALVERGLARNRKFKFAQRMVERAKIFEFERRSRKKPTLDVIFSAGLKDVQDGFDTDNIEWSLGFPVSWELDVWRRLAAAEKGALHDLGEQKAAYEAARLSLAAEISRNYYQVYRTQQLHDIAFRHQQKLVWLSKNRQVAPLLRAEIKKLGADVSRYRYEITEAKRRLQLLLDDYPDGQLHLPIERPHRLAVPDIGTPSAILARRPDLRAAHENVLAAYQYREASRLNRYPRFALTAIIGSQDVEFKDLIDPDSLGVELIQGVVAPIFDAGRRRAIFVNATLSQQDALDAYALTLLDAFYEIETLIELGHALQAQKIQVEQGLIAAKQQGFTREYGLQQPIQPYNISQFILESRQEYELRQQLLNLETQLLLQRLNLRLALGSDVDVAMLSISKEDVKNDDFCRRFPFKSMRFIMGCTPQISSLQQPDHRAQQIYQAWDASELESKTIPSGAAIK